ncbi:MAG TPA: diaminopimelate epimerase [Cytophagaceae bacterium]|jgi:diaminopimelate epimerase|nr:diaminopimelate epimerase [Cytophagaceae bacterium]
MELKFYKYQGTGNDFVMVDNRTKSFDISNTSLVAKLCHRRFGIGADGFILLENESGYDFKMVYFNSDGNESSMCGNGGRCIVQFAHDLGVIGDHTRFLAVDGVHDAYLEKGLVHLRMIDVTQIEHNKDHFYLNTGSPHYVKTVSNINDFQVFEEGRKIRYNDRFKEKGTNVNFTETKDDVLYVRTYERGVEDETYSCGTGVTASAIAASYSGMLSPVRINTLGGELSISFKKQNENFYDIFLIGPATKVFEGVVRL